MDKFEKLIKELVESFEAPYSEEAWVSLSKKLGPERTFGTGWAIGGIAAAIVIIAGIWYFLPKNENIVNANQLTSESVKQTSPSNNLVSDNKIELDNDTHSKPLKENENEETSRINHVKKESDLIQSDVQDEDITPLTDLQVNKIQGVNPELNNINPIINNNLQPKDEKPNDKLELIKSDVDFSKFNLNAVASEQEICVGESVSLSPSIPKLKAGYQWDLGNGFIVNRPYVDHKFDKPGDYNITLSLIDNKTKEIVNQTTPIIILVNPLPDNEIKYEFEDAALPDVNFTQKNDFVEHIEWHILGHYRTNTNTFSYSFKQKGNYEVTCKVRDHLGCESEVSENITIENNYNLLAPSAFTPNGDNLNETFIPKALLVLNTPFIMTIYDKSGKLVFTTNDASRPWDGLYTKDLTPAPSGAYVWIVQLTNEQNMTETYRGQVTITR